MTCYFICVLVTSSIVKFNCLQLLSTHVSLDQVVIPQVVQRYSLGLGDSSDSMTIVIISVTITTVIGKNYYHDSGHVVMSMCI